MAMSTEQIKEYRRVLKHRNRTTAYHFQLPAYTQMIRSLNATPFLDSKMINLLEALMDLLGRIADFDGYMPPDPDEFDLRELGVGFSFGCNYCNQKCCNARQVLDHVMTEDHSQLPYRPMKKLERFKKRSGDSYQAFLFQKHETMVKNRLPLQLLDRMIDFRLMTKNFLKMTSRYLASVNTLDRVPSTIIARGVIDLLNMIDLLVTRANCIESVPGFSTTMDELLMGDIKFAFRGRIFDQVHPAINHAVFLSGLKKDFAPPVAPNVFSLPQMVNVQPQQIQPNFLVTPLAFCNVPRPNITPFTAAPSVRMMPPPPSPQQPMPMAQSPMMSASMVRVGLDMQVINIDAQQQQQQQRLQLQQFHQQQQHLLFNPSMMNMPQNFPPQQQSVQHQQQQMAFMAFPPPSPQPPVSPGGKSADFPVARNNALRLPPLNQTGTVDCPVLSADLIHFLEQPDVDSLVENGNVLVNFAKSSVIPSEIVCALKGIAPDVRVECFGAKVSGVGYEEDIVNLYVDDAKLHKTPESVKELFETLKSFFINNSDEWVIQTIQEAEVRTHLTVKNSCENVCCRILFASEIYCYNSKLIRYYMETFPMYQKLCYFVQEFIKLTDLDFSRYIIIVLVLFYLQKRDYLPTVAQLQSRLPEEKTSGHWLINFVPRKPEDMKLKPCETDLRKSATDFFLFYGKQFSFQESVVCPQIGLALNRSDFLPENMWRMPLKRYRAYFEECQASATTNGDTVNNFARFEVTPMCVQDPLELTSNIAAQVSSADTGKFVQMCKMAYEFYLNNQ